MNTFNQTRVYTTRYRSDGLKSGELRQVGTLHMHIDGGGNSELVQTLLQSLEEEGFKGKLTAVSHSIAGPQRQEQPLTYESHTPNSGSDEELEYFSTTGLVDRVHAVAVLQKVLPQLAVHTGSVVEVERVVAHVENGKWNAVALEELAPIQSLEVGFEKNPSLPFEVHHAIDIKSQTEVPFALRNLLEDTTPLGVVVGGWFTFQKDDQWSYRSNSFWQVAGLQDRVMTEQQILHDYLSGKDLEYRLWSIVEKVIGIWRVPLRVVDR